MRRIQSFLLLIWLMSALTTTAHAQWATRRVEHDWRVRIGGNSYGLTQEFFSTFSTTAGTKTTIIYLGPHTYSTNLPAVWVTGLTLLPLGMVSFFLVSNLRNKSGS